MKFPSTTAANESFSLFFFCPHDIQLSRELIEEVVRRGNFFGNGVAQDHLMLPQARCICLPSLSNTITLPY